MGAARILFLPSTPLREELLKLQMKGLLQTERHHRQKHWLSLGLESLFSLSSVTLSTPSRVSFPCHMPAFSSDPGFLTPPAHAG